MRSWHVATAGLLVVMTGCQGDIPERPARPVVAEVSIYVPAMT